MTYVEPHIPVGELEAFLANPQGAHTFQTKTSSTFRSQTQENTADVWLTLTLH